MWLATRPKNIGEWAQSGLITNITNLGNWYCELPKSLWPNDPEIIKQMKKDISRDPIHKDRRQEIVMIGNFKEGDIQAITKALNKCLLTSKEMKIYMSGNCSIW